MPMIPYPTYRVSVITSDDPETYVAVCLNDSDPGESIASVQTLFPTWTEILIERIEHPYTEKK